jgi:hypothetical protein
MNTVFPYPPTGFSNEDIFWDSSKLNDPACEQKFYDRAIGKEATIYKSQFLSVEETLLQAFQFVSPAQKNAKAFSIKFASIIKESANIYELVSRHLYGQFYDYGNDYLNIYNYLSLDKHLEFSEAEINSFLFYDQFDASVEVYHPFDSISGWDKVSSIQSSHIPKWWTAYNKLKHTNEGLDTRATLVNAIAAVGAVFVLLHKVYGPGVVAGHLITPGNHPRRILSPTVSRMFQIV